MESRAQHVWRLAEKLFLDVHGPSCTSFAFSGRPRPSFLRLISCNKFHACFHCVPLHAGAGSPVTNSRPACCGAATVSVGEWPCTQALIGEWPKSSWSYSPAQASLGRESRLGPVIAVFSSTSSVAGLAFFVVIRTTLSLRWKCLEMVRTALEAGLPRPARAHQRLALLAAATRAKVFHLPEALAMAAVGRRHGQGRQRQAQGRQQGQERFSWFSAPWMNALEPLAPPGLTLLRVRFDHGAVANGVARHAVVSHAGSGAAIWPMASPPAFIPHCQLHHLQHSIKPQT